jgi:hypothetical protein
VEKAIKNRTYTPEYCVTGPESSSSDHGYMMSGVRAVPVPAEEARPLDVPLPHSPLPVGPESVLAKGHGLGLMDRYWKTTGKFLTLGKFFRININAV